LAHPVIFAASPRPGGNSDAAAGLVARGMAGAGERPEIVHLRDYAVAACLGCGHCARSERGQCVLDGQDQAGELFAKLLGASMAVFTAPIYFYHLPAGFKAWIDRSQRHYARWQSGDPQLAGRSELPAYACLVAGRPRGERLFEGSLLTLRFFLKTFNFSLRDSVTIMGMDAAGELAADQQTAKRLEDFGRAVALEAGGG
jgi:multimeric flavodoxin WrbA